MSLQKTEAIVLKSQKLGETSKIITLYTRKYGKMKVVAKGARGLRSHFYGTLESVNHVSIVFYLKEKRELQFLSQADIIDSFRGIKNNLDKLSFVLVACEIIIRSQYAEESNPNLFKKILEFLNKIDKAETKFENYFFWFQLKFLELNGFKPRFDKCIFCGRQNIKDNKLYFSLPKGGYICSSCKTNEFAGLLISSDTVDYLNALEKTESEKIADINNSGQGIRESSHILNKFMGYHIDGLDHLKSVKFLEQVKS